MRIYGKLMSQIGKVTTTIKKHLGHMGKYTIWMGDVMGFRECSSVGCLDKVDK